MIPAPRDATAGPAGPVGAARDPVTEWARAAGESDPAAQVGVWRFAAALVDPDSTDDLTRDAFVLSQLLGLSYAEAAAVAGVPVGTIRSRVARARDDLVEAVGDAMAG
ncbi:sigma factor-like helix-turn-helix DNA-binding protein [Micromonospora sp. NPDC023737]|uniref:sigma factor-like helix-turn-helix DNA-binding protein n=1 Tax=unclassified Micromonospora TaxID=2617518 RepID=UPI0033FCC4B1